MLRIETMTLNQVVARLRALGIRTTELKVETALQRGVYPWGVYIPGELGVRLEDFGLVGEDGFESFCTLTHELIVI